MQKVRWGELTQSTTSINGFVLFWFKTYLKSLVLTPTVGQTTKSNRLELFSSLWKWRTFCRIFSKTVFQVFGIQRLTTSDESSSVLFSALWIIVKRHSRMCNTAKEDDELHEILAARADIFHFCHMLSGVPYCANLKCAGRSRPWRLQRWVNRLNPTTLDQYRHVWSRRVTK